MAKAKRKRIVKPKEDKQVMDGLDMPFEQAIGFLAQQPDKPKEQPKDK